MPFRYFLVALAAVFGSSCASLDKATKSFTLENAIVSARSTIPPYSGFIRSWIQLNVRAEGADFIVLLPHFEDGRHVPGVGDVCQISYHIESVEGQVGESTTRIKSAKVVDRLDCKSVGAT